MRELTDEKYPVTWDIKRMVFVFVVSFLFQIIRYILNTSDFELSKYSNVLWWLGLVLVVFGILDNILEKRMDLGLIYTESGMIMNACVVCSVGIVLIADGFLQNFFWALGVAAVIGIESYIVDIQRSKRKKRYIGQTGIAITDINYKGKGKFKEEVLKVRVTHDKIEQGAMIKITDVDGFNLIVETKGYRVL